MAVWSSFTLILSLAAVTVVRPVAGKEVCYPVVGCFNNNPPFDNAGDSQLPANPLEVGTKFHLYTREKMYVPTSLVYTQPVSITKSNFRSDRPTKVIIHGLNNNEKSKWIINMRVALLKQGDYNVIVIHWGRGSVLTNYAGASANVRLVATQLKVLLKLLQRVAGLQLEDVHLIGHSLGAHAAGYTGTLMGDRIARITGLDPADPNFEDLPYVVRLDPTDAQFVDVIHTDGLEYASTVGFGLAQQSGHIDFYVNGGKNQKGCEDGIQGLFGGFLNAVRGRTDTSVISSAGAGMACSHARAHSVFVESINSKCRFKSFPCENYAKFLRGECYGCSSSGCSAAGLYAQDYPTAQGKHYLMTYAEDPLCGTVYYNLFIEVKAQTPSRGEIKVELRNEKGSHSREILLIGRDTTELGGSNINMPIVLDKSLSELGQGKLRIKLTYQRRTGMFPAWSLAAQIFYIKRVEITEVTTGQRLISSRRTRELHHNIPNEITLTKDTKVGGVTG